MSLPLIRAALEGRLDALEPKLPTQWENVAFKPVAGTAWQRAVLMTSETRAMGVVADAPEQWTGYLHITLNYPANQAGGAKAAEARATALIGDRVRSIEGHFYRGQALMSQGAAVVIYQPYVRPATSDSDWYSLPVHIPFMLNTN